MFEKLKKFFIGLILAALAISSCTRAIPDSSSSLEKSTKSTSKSWFGSLFKAASTPTPPGDYVLTVDVKDETIKEARTRSYTLHVPSSYDSSTAVGLLMLFPADAQKASEFMKETKFQKFTDKEGYILVVPDQYGEGLKWNNGVSNTAGPSDVLFIQTLLKELKSNLKIDENKVFMSGKGKGGIMAFQAAAALSDQVAGVGVYGAAIGIRPAKDAQALKVSNPSTPFSVIAIHGLRDNNIPANQTAKMKKSGTGYLTFADMEKFWVKALGCTGKMQAKQTKNEHILRHTWNACQNGTSLQSYTIWTGTAAWAQGNAKLHGQEVDIPATQLIWEFLSNHPKAASK
jgi:polyhydroxybutyrate depolymerase